MCRQQNFQDTNCAVDSYYVDISTTHTYSILQISINVQYIYISTYTFGGPFRCYQLKRGDNTGAISAGEQRTSFDSPLTPPPPSRWWLYTTPPRAPTTKSADLLQIYRHIGICVYASCLSDHPRERSFAETILTNDCFMSRYIYSYICSICSEEYLYFSKQISHIGAKFSRANFPRRRMFYFVSLKTFRKL